MSLFSVLYVLALCLCAAAIIYGIVRPERPRRAPDHAAPAAPKRSRRAEAVPPRDRHAQPSDA